jgi:hypothetical protein
MNSRRALGLRARGMQPPFPFPPHLPKRIGCALRCVRDLFAEQARRPPQILATVNDQYVLDLANVFLTAWRPRQRRATALPTTASVSVQFCARYNLFNDLSVFFCNCEMT